MTLPGLMQETPLTLRGIFDRMRTVHADARIVDPQGQRTYGELAERVLRLCRVLTDDLGVRPGDRVASFAVNSARHLELYWAVPLVGAVLHTVNIRLYDEQIAYLLDHAHDRVVFADPDLLDQVGALAAAAPSVERTIALGDEYDSLLAAAAPLHPDHLLEVPENAAFGLCYTSGTTGMPKGVLHSHRAMYLHAMGTCMADSIGLREEDRVLPIVPMFHAFAWGLPYAAALTGAELLLHGADTSPEAVGALIATERATVAAAVPTIWKGLLPLLERGALDSSSLRLVFVGGSASPRPLIEAYDDLGIDYLNTGGPHYRRYSEEMMGGVPDNASDLYHARSPLNFIAGIRGRLLIVHGLGDTNVSPLNTHAACAALDAAGVPYELLLFPDEGHGIWKRDNRRRLFLRLARFFEAAFREQRPAASAAE